MEKKTKHRILGVLVVIGLVLISLPFLQSNGNESPVNASLVTAPPFPDQSTQVSTTVTETKPNTVQPSPIPLHDPSQPTVSDGGVNQQPDDTIRVTPAPKNPNALPTTPGVVPETKKSEATAGSEFDSESEADTVVNKPQPPVNTKAAPMPGDSTASPEGTDYLFKNSEQSFESDNATPAPPRKTKSHHFNPIKVRMTKANQQPDVLSDNGLFKLKSAAWVVQMGSFKNKENALRLVNKLRLLGYHAFIQQAANYTQVFVGPESRENAAKLLKIQIENDLHLSGMVISYKPLKL